MDVAVKRDREEEEDEGSSRIRSVPGFNVGRDRKEVMADAADEDEEEEEGGNGLRKEGRETT